MAPNSWHLNERPNPRLIRFPKLHFQGKKASSRNIAIQHREAQA